MAAFAGAHAGRFGILQRVMKGDVFWVGGSGRAGGAAIDAGGRYRVPEFSVRLWVAGQYSGPAGVGFDRVGFSYRLGHIGASRLFYHRNAGNVPAPHSAACFQIDQLSFAG